MNRTKTVGLWVTIIAGIFSVFWNVYTYWSPFEDKLRNSDDFLGIWESKYSYSITNGMAGVEGTTEYFRNGKYNFVGAISISYVTKNSDAMKVTYDVDGTGTWNNDSSNLYITLTDVISSPKNLQMNEDSYDLNHPKSRELIPKLESVMPSNISEQYSIIAKKPTLITFELDDPKGNMFSIVMRKVDKRFQRQLN